MTKILVVEDDDAVRVGLADELTREGHEVWAARSGAEARERALNNPDLIVLDWMLPDTQGVELLKSWRATGVKIPTILLTARSELIDKVLGLELGANDYMTKPFEIRELIARIRAHLRVQGRRPLRDEPIEIRANAISMGLAAREVRFKGELREFTKTEFDLLKLFLENPNQVFSREELLKKVWGFENYPTTRTVDTHILQLRNKLANEYFETVHGIGYRFRVKK